MAKLTKVKILQSLAGVKYTYQRGSIQNLDSALAKEWEKAGLCEIIAKPARTFTKKVNAK